MSAGLVAYEEIKTFIEDGWIEEVLFPLKSGKEANVYCCLACPGRGHAFFALKVYKSKKSQFPRYGRLSGGARHNQCADRARRSEQEPVWTHRRVRGLGSPRVCDA